jgi:hypothetical protein
MWNFQEQEERDYYPQSDLQLAYEWSRRTREPDDPRIQEALDAGKFVVVAAHTQYCRSTDAILGSRKDLVAACDTREQAADVCRAMHDKLGDGDEDLSIFVLPLAPRPILTDPPGDWETPF